MRTHYRRFLLIVALLIPCTTSLTFGASEPISSPITLMWQVHNTVSEADFRILRKVGVNTIQSFALASWSEKDIKCYLDQANNFSLRVIIYLGNLLIRSNNREPRFDKTCADFIEKWKYHPAILAWHTIDEPKLTEKRLNKYSQELAYNFIKRHDPNRPVMISHNCVSQAEYDQFFSEKAFDILELHAYVNPDITTRQSQLISLFNENKSRDYPVIISLRAFNGPGWIDLKPDSLQNQYDFFINGAGITKSVGFYGWALAPNKGIKELESLLTQCYNLKLI